jgi:hypothetical protein
MPIAVVARRLPREVEMETESTEVARCRISSAGAPTACELVARVGPTDALFFALEITKRSGDATVPGGKPRTVNVSREDAQALIAMHKVLKL